jgi:hypothetical protein
VNHCISSINTIFSPSDPLLIDGLGYYEHDPTNQIIQIYCIEVIPCKILNQYLGCGPILSHFVIIFEWRNGWVNFSHTTNRGFGVLWAWSNHPNNSYRPYRSNPHPVFEPLLKLGPSCIPFCHYCITKYTIVRSLFSCLFNYYFVTTVSSFSIISPLVCQQEGTYNIHDTFLLSVLTIQNSVNWVLPPPSIFWYFWFLVLVVLLSSNNLQIIHLAFKVPNSV